MTEITIDEWIKTLILYLSSFAKGHFLGILLSSELKRVLKQVLNCFFYDITVDSTILSERKTPSISSV